MSRRSQGRKSASRLPTGLMVGAGLLFIAGLYFGVQLGKPPPPPDFGALNATPEPQQVGDSGVSTPSAPPSAGFAENDPQETSTPPPSEVAPSPPPAAESASAPRIAIVIDDLGRSLDDITTLRQLGIPITYAVLPFESQTAAVVAELRSRGEEILCHLPMEAKGGNNPGPGALLSSMDRAELEVATRRALNAVPGAVGVNNHMGSSIASDPQAIETVMSVVAESRLYFLDSRTSVDTLGYATARRLGLPAGERQVFLDTEITPEAVEAQFDRLLKLAQQRGQAIAIGHPHAVTLDVLTRRVPEARAQGIQFVLASALLDR